MWQRATAYSPYTSTHGASGARGINPAAMLERAADLDKQAEQLEQQARSIRRQAEELRAQARAAA